MVQRFFPPQNGAEFHLHTLLNYADFGDSRAIKFTSVILKELHLDIIIYFVHTIITGRFLFEELWRIHVSLRPTRTGVLYALDKTFCSVLEWFNSQACSCLLKLSRFTTLAKVMRKRNRHCSMLVVSPKVMSHESRGERWFVWSAW